MNKKYIVRLVAEEREKLESLVKRGKNQVYKIKHANILLIIDADGPNVSDHDAAIMLRCHQNTVRNVRQRFVEAGLDAALERKEQQRPSRAKKLDGEKEARLIAVACSEPPSGRAKWTLHMLADELVSLNVVDEISHETVRQTLKKTNLSLICGNAG
jgi:transposase